MLQSARKIQCRLQTSRLLTRPTLVHLHKRHWTTLSRKPDSVIVHALNDASFPYVWLRDSCIQSVHPSTRQKLHLTSDIPIDIAPEDHEEAIRVTREGLEVEWKDGRTSVYEKSWLERYATPGGVDKFHMDTELRKDAWTRSSVSSLPDLFVSYSDINTPEGLVKGITQLSKYGLLFVRGVPNRETSNEKCELRVLGERFGELRRTFYGLLWDVINVKESKNIAYTDLALALHMDLL